MNHLEAKQQLIKILPEEQTSLLKVEIFRRGWEGKGYDVISEETGYDHDYVRHTGSELWKDLSAATGETINKRNFRKKIQSLLSQSQQVENRQFEYPGAPLSIGSIFYVERPEEIRAFSEMERPASVIRIKGPGYMGKSSLLLRLLEHAQNLKYHTATVNLLQADSSILKDLDKFLQWICLQICRELKIDSNLDSIWSPILGSKVACTSFLVEKVLPQLDKPLVLIFKSLHEIFDYTEVSSDFLAMLRSWTEEGKHNSDFKGFRQILTYSTETYVQLDINLSPFNVGLPLELRYFTKPQLSKLATAYGYQWGDFKSAESPINQLMEATAGHPYMCQLALYELATHPEFVESPSESLVHILRKSSRQGGIYSDFLFKLLSNFQSNQLAADAFKKVLSGAITSLSRREYYQLERLGAIMIKNGKPDKTGKIVQRYLEENL